MLLCCGHILSSTRLDDSFLFSPSLKWRLMSGPISLWLQRGSSPWFDEPAGVGLIKDPRKSLRHTQLGMRAMVLVFYTWHIFLELGFRIEIEAGGKTTSLHGDNPGPETHLSSIFMGKNSKNNELLRTFLWKCILWDFLKKTDKLLILGNHNKLNRIGHF